MSFTLAKVDKRQKYSRELDATTEQSMMSCFRDAQSWTENVSTHARRKALGTSDMEMRELRGKQLIFEEASRLSDRAIPMETAQG